MKTKDEALKMAIGSLKRYGDTYGGTDGDFEALNACERALEQPTQEWQGLSDEEIGNALNESDWPTVLLSDFAKAKLIEFYKAIEQKLKEKNI